MALAPIIDKQVLLAKIEGTYNTDPVIADTDAHLVYEPSFDLAAETWFSGIQSANDYPVLSSQIGRIRPTVSFKTPLRGHLSGLSAVRVPADNILDRACGYSPVWDGVGQTWTYTRDLSTQSSIWIEQVDYSLQQMAGGCRGSWKLTGEPGKIAWRTWSFLGHHQEVDDVPAIAATHSNAKPLLCEGTTFAPYGDAPAAGEFGRWVKWEIDIRNEMFLAEDTNAAQGLAEVWILGHGSPTDRGIMISGTITQPQLGASDRWYRRFLDRTEAGAFSLVMGSSTVGLKQTCTLNFPGIEVISHKRSKVGSLFAQDVVCRVQDGNMTLVWKQY